MLLCSSIDAAMHLKRYGNIFVTHHINIVKILTKSSRFVKISLISSYLLNKYSCQTFQLQGKIILIN